MRSSLLLPLLLLPLACATQARIVATADDRALTVDEVAADLAQADVVVLGEEHRTPPVHAVHHELIHALHDRRPDMVIAMEMFERDTQALLMQYVAGVVDESTFLASARPWPDYDRDYRPVIEFAKENGLFVLAANAPRKLARQVSKEGVQSVAGNQFVARETTAPEDDYWRAFVAVMKDHPGTTPENMKRMYEAQCLKDDTMAESITDHLKRRSATQRPLVVLICGRQHSDHGRGTVARIQSRMPALDVRVLSAETVADVGAGIYSAPRSIASYVVVSPQVERPEPAAEPMAAAPAAAAPKPVEPATPVADEPNPEGVRPALGFMPDYSGSGKGVRVGAVREGGPAEQAGIEEGDVITTLAGTTIEDVRHYSEVLDGLRIGKTVTVRVRREAAEVDLQVKVGSRPATR